MTSAGLQADTSAGLRFPASEDDLKVHPMIAILTDPVHAHQALSLVREIGEASGGEVVFFHFFYHSLPWIKTSISFNYTLSSMYMSTAFSVSPKNTNSPFFM